MTCFWLLTDHNHGQLAYHLLLCADSFATCKDIEESF